MAPPTADLGPDETQRFLAYGVTAAGDTVPEPTVEWHATGGTITPDGVFTAGLNLGVFSVTATRPGGGPLPGRAAVSVFRRLVATLRVQPDTATLPIQGSWPLRAAALDSAGDPVPSVRITWASDNPDVARVDEAGLVTAVAPGTATVTAASQGRTDSAVVVVVPPGSGPWPNEPSGFRVISDQPWQSATSLGWFLDFGVSPQVITDATAPLSPPDVLQIVYPVGFVGGTAPTTLTHGLAGVRQLYIGLWWKPSNPWQGHSSNGNKIQYAFTSEQGSIFMAMYGPPGGPYELRAFPQFMTSSDIWLTPNVNHAPIALGQWHKIEWLIVYNTTDDPPNGICRWWLDGQLIGDYYNVRYPSAGLTEYKLAPVWGGVGDTKRELDYYWFDHVRVSGR